MQKCAKLMYISLSKFRTLSRDDLNQNAVAKVYECNFILK